MKIKTKIGEIETIELEQVGPRTKYWAEALQDLARLDEILCVLGTALEEAYRTGAVNAILSIKFKKGDIIDAEATVIVEAGGEAGGAAEGPEPEQPDDSGDAGRSPEPPAEAADVPGCSAEGSGGESQHAEKVEETP